ncbi:MAG: dihydroxy-acid dehydratase [Desulfobacterales bacterium]|nr:dihydroxy-acid dehydratase [Desulfobacterales bacterium]
MKKSKSDVIFDDSDFPISVVRKSIFQGTGVDMEELREKPLIAVANSHTDMNPGHMHLNTISQRVKEGVHAGGGIPFEFNVPAPCDGITEGHDGMRYVLAQRDLIADIIETHIRSMRLDGVVFVAGCDKIVPGMIMAAARLNLPSIFITGGPNAWDIRFKSTMKGSVDHKSYEDVFDKLATATAATCGSCELMGTANTMQSLTEALGLSILGSASVPAYHSGKLLYARNAGKRIVNMVEEGFCVENILTMDAIENAVMVDLAIGGSTNSTLHLPAIAHELWFELPLEVFNHFNKKVPTLCKISPSGPYGIQDLFMAGGIPGVMKMLADDLHLEALNVTGSKLGDLLEFVQVSDSNIIPDKRNAYLPEGGTAILSGNLAPEGAVIKQSAVEKEMFVFNGPARVFDSERDALTAIRENKIEEGDVIVIRYEGPKGGPGMPETLAVTMGLEASGVKRAALLTDGRFSGATAGPCIGHISPEACVGGPIAALMDGDVISIDIPGRKLTVALSDQEIKDRLSTIKPAKRDIPKGYMQRYVKYVSSAAKGAILE